MVCVLHGFSLVLHQAVMCENPRLNKKMRLAAWNTLSCDKHLWANL